MNLRNFIFRLVCMTYLLIYVYSGQDLIISHAGFNKISCLNVSFDFRGISASGHKYDLKSAAHPILPATAHPFANPYRKLCIADQHVNSNKMSLSGSVELASGIDSDTLNKVGNIEKNHKSRVTDTISANNNFSHLTLVDSVARSFSSLSDHDSANRIVIYFDSIVHNDICYQEPSNTKCSSGPYSQSVSNLKDY